MKGLGMVASGKRNIKSGAQYNSLFPSFSKLERTDAIINKNGDVFDTLIAIEKIIKETLEDTRKLAQKLKGSTRQQTCTNIWNFIYNHIQYAKDKEGVEQLHRPLRIWEKRRTGVDCDDMALMAGSLLYNLEIPFALRMTKYNGREYFQHVYVVVPKSGNDYSTYFTIDPVVDKNNYEVKFSDKHDRKIMPMPIQYLNGLGNLSDQVSGVSGGVSLGAFSTLHDGGILGFGSEFNGLDSLGLGAAPGNVGTEFMTSLRQHLINTRNLAIKNPQSVVGYDPQRFIERIDYLLANFKDAKARDRVLDELEKMESLEGLGIADDRIFDENYPIEGLGDPGLGGFFSKLKKGVKKVGQGVAKGAKGVAKGAKVVGKAIIRYNPVSIAARNGLLLAFKLNLFNMSQNLGYGYWSDAQALSKGFDMNELAKYRQSLSKVQKIFYSLQGKEEHLRKAILAGWEKGVKKHKMPWLPVSEIEANAKKQAAASKKPVAKKAAAAPQKPKFVRPKNITARPFVGRSHALAVKKNEPNKLSPNKPAAVSAAKSGTNAARPAPVRRTYIKPVTSSRPAAQPVKRTIIRRPAPVTYSRPAAQPVKRTIIRRPAPVTSSRPATIQQKAAPAKSIVRRIVSSYRPTVSSSNRTTTRTTTTRKPTFISRFKPVRRLLRRPVRGLEGIGFSGIMNGVLGEPATAAASTAAASGFIVAIKKILAELSPKKLFKIDPAKAAEKIKNASKKSLDSNKKGFLKKIFSSKQNKGKKEAAISLIKKGQSLIAEGNPQAGKALLDNAKKLVVSALPANVQKQISAYDSKEVIAESIPEIKNEPIMQDPKALQAGTGSAGLLIGALIVGGLLLFGNKSESGLSGHSSNSSRSKTRNKSAGRLEKVSFD